MRFGRRIEGCCEYWIEWKSGGKHFAIGKYNPNDNGMWFLEVGETHHLIRKTLFWWSHELQGWLYKRGIYWHNWIIDECTPGFECCMHKIPLKDRQVFKDLYRAVEEQIGYVLYRKR